MKITVNKKCLKKLDSFLKENPLNVSLPVYVTDSNELDLSMVDVLGLESLANLLENEGDIDSPKRIKNTIKLLKGSNTKIVSLEMLQTALASYFKLNNVNWLVSTSSDSSSLVAYAVTELDISTSDRHYRNKREDYLRVELAFNSKGSFCSRQLTFFKNDLRLPLLEILKNSGVEPLTELTKTLYDSQLSKYKGYLEKHSYQFWARKQAVSFSRSYWDTLDAKNLSILGKPSKVVLDLRSMESKQRPDVYSSVFEKDILVPIHTVLPVFSLVYHSSYWVHVSNLKEYKYENTDNTLVLPPSHSSLINALVSNLEVLKLEAEAEDKSRMIRAKAKSSVIICSGPPGTGKTLTAEVFSERIERPLYEVNCGQLGINAEEVEEELQKVLERSSGLNMTLVINEADTFIQSRADDLNKNAIVSCFLRQLEYHDGLVFLTTNRQDIDDAVRSRAIAEISYTWLTEANSKTVWLNTLKEFNRPLPDADLDSLVSLFDKITGRDILNLVRLTSRVCEANKTKFSVKALKENSVFKGLKLK